MLNWSYTMRTDYPIVLNPICVEIIEKTQKSDYFPFSDDGKYINYRKCAQYLKARGYLYDILSKKYFKLERDGLYYSVPEEDIITELYSLIYFHNPNYNAEPHHVKDILGVFTGNYTSSTLNERFIDFLKTSDLGMDYEIGFEDEMKGYRIIPLSNGIFNPCVESDGFPFKLLPHNGLYFAPLGGKYDLEFYPIPESDLFSIPISEDFLKILGDKRTLECFLWWSGAVLFSNPYRLPTFVLLYGPGGTGKDSLSGCLSSILGEMSGHTGLSKLNDARGLAPLFGKKLNISSEMEGKFDKGLLGSIKHLTGGTKVMIDPKYRPAFEIDPPALLFTGNVFPNVDTSDSGIMRRVHVYDCSNIDLSKDGIDWPTLMRDNDHKNWLFNAAYYYWRKYSDMPPDKMKSESMRKMESRFNLFNPLSSWIFEKFGTLDRAIVRKKLNRSSLKDMYDDYRIFTSDIGGKAYGRNNFSEKLQSDYGLILAPLGSTRVFKLKEEA